MDRVHVMIKKNNITYKPGYIGQNPKHMSNETHDSAFVVINIIISDHDFR